MKNINLEKLETLLASVTEDQKHNCYSCDRLCEEFRIYESVMDYDSVDQHIKCADLITWICTDTKVGLKAYYLDDILICISFQPYRKSDENFYWIGKEEYLKTRNFFLSLLDEENNINEIDSFDDEDFEFVLNQKQLFDSYKI